MTRREALAFPALLIRPQRASALDAAARQAMLRAARFFCSIATEGGYLWWYSADLTQRAGESPATETQIWVQPPGTPSVGEAYLRAWKATGEDFLLECAQAAARALVRGQLESGGWDYLVEFDPALRPRWNYRLDPAPRGRNVSTYDDDTTQSAVRFLLRLVTARDDIETRLAAEYALESAWNAQHPNGAFSQRFPLPESGYARWYTFNDNLMAQWIQTMIQAWGQLQDERAFRCAERVGDFILLSQLPEPHPVWAQQYDFEMQPAWARRFEPPAACSSESVNVIRALIQVWILTGDGKYLEPIPPAIEWFNRSVIRPNTWARFYELGTNRPLYFTSTYELVYTDHDLPAHYSFQGSYGVAGMIREYEEMRRIGLEEARERRTRPLTPEQKAARRRALEPRVASLIETLDEQGRWLRNGRIECSVFVTNMATLSEYLELAG